MFLRALRALRPELAWRATVWSPRPLPPRRRSAGRCASGSSSSTPTEMSEAEALAGADVLVLASEGLRPVPGTLVRALAGGVLPIASRLPVYEELLGQGEYGFEFEPGDVQTLPSHLSRLIAEPALRERQRPSARASFARGSRGRAWPTSSSRSTPGWSPAGTTTRGNGRSARGSPPGG